MPKKTSYRIRNWPAYNAALSGRGSLTLWVDEAAIRSWRYTGPTQRGAQYHYADTAISCVLTLRAVYHLALRAAEGLARSVFAPLATGSRCRTGAAATERLRLSGRLPRVRRAHAADRARNQPPHSPAFAALVTRGCRGDISRRIPTPLGLRLRR